METTEEKLAIEKLIFCYGDAFNAADISKVVSLFTPNGINMPNNAPLAKGREQLTKAFEFLLNNAQINIRYIIDEILISGAYAYVRTNSRVNTVIKANGNQISLENKELFVLLQNNGDWKISHYIFNNTKIIN